MFFRRRAGTPAERATSGERETPDGVLRRLHWTVLRPLATYLGGDEHSLQRGPATELTELRPYQPGDDVRHIDWNTTARADEPYVREGRVERALDAWLALDLSASVDWGTATCLKRDRGVELVAVAGELLGRRGHRLGALLFAERPLAFLPPASGRAHLLRLLRAVRDEPRQARPGATDLQAALQRADAIIRRRSLVLVVSDFLVPDGWQTPLGKLAQRHEVIAVRLSDPREALLPDVGLITLEDPETGRQLLVDSGDRALRERFQRAAEAQSERIRGDLAAYGVDCLTLSTGDDLLPAIARFLRLRRLSGRQGGARALAVPVAIAGHS